MMKLNTFRYLKNNKKRVGILIVSFALYITLIYGLRFFLNPIQYTHENVVTGRSSYMQGVFINRGDIMDLNQSLWEEGSSASVDEKIAELNRASNQFANSFTKDENIDYVFPCSIYQVNIHTLISSRLYYIPLLTKEEVQTVCSYLNVTLQKGRMPENPAEFIIDQRMAANLNIGIGDSMNEDGTVVCGIVESDYYFAAGIHYNDGFIKRNLLFLNDRYITDMQEYMKKLGFSASYSEYDDIYILWDLEGGKEDVKKDSHELEPVLFLVIIVVTIILAGTLFIVYQLHVQDRYEEWCLYRSLGFGQREIYWLAVKEFLFCLFAGIGLAVCFLILIYIIGGGLMDSKGIVYRFFMPEVFQQILMALCFLAGILHLPVFMTMKQIRTIDAIDEDV